jgi:hypothetical protein
MSKVRVLFLVSNPSGEDRLAVDEESRVITARIRSTDHRDAIEFITAWAVRPDDLQQLLLQHRPRVVHFSGHGTRSLPTGDPPAGVLSSLRDMKKVGHAGHLEHLVLTGEGGQVQPMSTAVLVHLFRVLKDNVHLVLLSACHSEPIAEALTEVIPYTIGMCETISDAAAIAFSTAFYQALGYGRNIQEAFDLGKNALMSLQWPEDHVPRLFSRKDCVAPTKVVLVSPPTARTRKGRVTPSGSHQERSSPSRGHENLLHAMWDSLDGRLQDAFSLAYNKKRRQGGTRISTKDFFQALVRLQDDSVRALIESLPAGALPDPIDPNVPKGGRLVLEEEPLLSDCVADSLAHFQELRPLPRKISSADMFIDIARHGHGESVSRLRRYGVGKREIEEKVQELGIPNIKREGD